MVIYNNVIFLLNELFWKIAALINQYYEFSTSNGQVHESDMYNLCYDVIFIKITYITMNVIYLSLLYMCRCNKLCFDTKIYVYSIGHYMINILYFKNHGMAKNLYYAVLIKKYVYIPYYFIHLSLLYMFGYK